MSKQLPALKAAQVLRALHRAGFKTDHVRGSHHYLIHPSKPSRRVTVPFHGSDLKRRTLTSIIDQAGFSVKDFLEFL